jgi:hypothetical protein
MTAQVEDKTSDERLRQLVEALGDLPGIILLSLRTGKSTSNLREGRRVGSILRRFRRGRIGRRMALAQHPDFRHESGGRL